MFVQINDLHFSYKGAHEETIKGFSISITKGEIVSLLGDSGSGKSTILRLIAGLEMPNQGVVVVNDCVCCDDCQFMPPEARGVGMVFQDYALFPHMTVEKNIRFGLHKLNRKERNARVEEMLALVNLTEFRHRYPYELSGGQQQRVALARALAPKPSLLILDEPFSNLDTSLQHRIRDDLRRLLKQTGTTTIFVTHDEEDAEALADRIVYLGEGKIKKQVMTENNKTFNPQIPCFV
ncbi:ABC transporter ATP-binding protein [Exiguobacterium profundum]|uniref:ABC transporter ATP-binding protein n=1 Tax=Exiguobacterium profundum TaxID=307643 RepID=UPI0028A1608D|nr:ABC transporter ATP-binding protein [Exiguobacterium profundum]